MSRLDYYNYDEYIKSLCSKFGQEMEIFHTADDFTIVRQANKMGNITVGYSYFKITKVSSDEAKFYKDSSNDKNS